jgi:hypothetical protein
MSKKAKAAAPAATRELRPERRECADCGKLMWADYAARRSVATLQGVVRLRLTVRRCRHEGCPAYHRPYRPEAEGRLALPHHEFGLDVIALVGRLRYAEHRSVPEIRAAVVQRGVAICERTVTNLLDRYDELLATTLTDGGRLKGLLAGQGKAVLAVDGMQPDVGHEVLWVIRDCLSGEVLLARSLLSPRQKDLAALLKEVRDKIGVPVAAVVSDGQHSIRKAVAKAFPGVPHQLCHFHWLREAAKPVFEADRNAKKELKKRVRGVRPLERAVEGREGPAAEAVRGYASAVRSAITDDGRPPLEAAGLRLHGRLSAISASIARAGGALAGKGGCRPSWCV